MEYPSDSFVNYTDTTVPPNESFPDLDFMLQSPITDSSGVPSYTHETNSLIYNQSVSNQSYGSPYASPEEQRTTKVQKRRQKAANPENGYGVEENNEKNMIELSNQSKKIQKRNKAKQRAKLKQNMAQVLATAPEKYIPSGIDDPNLDDKTKRKMIQMAKNRMAAQKTRDRKKQYTSELEEVKEHLNRVNDELAEKNRLLEERIKALEVSQMYLMQENQELKKNQFVETFYQSSAAPSENTGFDSTSNDEYRSMPSPALIRGQSRSNNNYWNFFLGIIAICAIFTGINIKIGQETENLPDPFKNSLDEWTMETSYPHDVTRKEVVEEPVVAETFSVKTSDETQPSTFKTMNYASGDKSGREEQPPIAMMSTMPVGDFQGHTGGFGPSESDAMSMSIMMAASASASQPKTPLKSKWEWINEFLTYNRGRSYPWDDPNYVDPYLYKVYQPKTPKKSNWEYINEILTLHTGMSYPWNNPIYHQNTGDDVYIETSTTTKFLVNHEELDRTDDVNVNTTNFDDHQQQQQMNENLAIQAV